MIDVLNLTAPYVGGTADATVYQLTPFIDINIWFIIVILSVVFLLASHVTNRGYEISAILAFAFAVTGLWSSMSISSAQILAVNTTANITAYEPYVISMASPWLTYLMIIYAIVAFINIIYVVLVTRTEEIAEENQRRFRVR